jgi:hypothetical protein
MYQFSLSGILYNACLSYYFLLVARFGVQERKIAKRYEPVIHLLSAGFPLISASIGAGLGFYHENTFGTGVGL